MVWKEVDMEVVKGAYVNAAEAYCFHILHVTDTC